MARREWRKSESKPREWGYTDRENPCASIKGVSEKDRKHVYIEDDVFNVAHQAANQPLKDTMDLAYLTGQRPADLLKMTETDFKDGELIIRQNKTDKKLRISIEGELYTVISRIMTRKAGHKIRSLSLIVDDSGQRMMPWVLQRHFRQAREAAGIDPSAFQFWDLRGKAGTDETESSGDIRQAQKQLGHATVSMTEH